MAEGRVASLHIGVDARELQGHPTGVGRFLARVLQAWADSPEFRHRVSLFLPGAAPEWVARLGSPFNVVVDPRRESGGSARSQSRGTLWEQTRLPRLAARAGVDVLFCPGYTAPLWASCPSAVVIHDVSFFAHPEWFSWRERLRRQWITRAGARRAAVVITVSEFSAEEIQKWLGVTQDRVRVIRHGSPDVDRGREVIRAPLVLFVGSIFNRRHLPEMIAAFARVLTRVPDARLVLVGDNRTTPRQDPHALASAAQISASVEWRQYVDDEELNRLYAAARVFMFLSDYEGFAMTPLEALAHGVPSVLLDTPVAREVYGSAARYVCADPDRIAAELEDLLTNETMRTRLLEDGERLLRQYTWTRTGAEVLAAIEDAAQRS